MDSKDYFFFTIYLILRMYLLYIFSFWWGGHSLKMKNYFFIHNVFHWFTEINVKGNWLFVLFSRNHSDEKSGPECCCFLTFLYKPMCAQVAAMTSWAQNKSKKNILLMQNSASPLCYLTPDAYYSPNLHTPLKMLITCSNMLSICLDCRFNMLHTCSQHAINEHYWNVLQPSPDMNTILF